MPIPCKDCPHCSTCTPTNIGSVCKPVEPKKKWTVTYSAMFTDDGRPSGRFTVNATTDAEATQKAQMVMEVKSKELGVNAFHLNITDE